jgi:hypothetical protein
MKNYGLKNVFLYPEYSWVTVKILFNSLNISLHPNLLATLLEENTGSAHG